MMNDMVWTVTFEHAWLYIYKDLLHFVNLVFHRGLHIDILRLHIVILALDIERK